MARSRKYVTPADAGTVRTGGAIFYPLRCGDVAKVYGAAGHFHECEVVDSIGRRLFAAHGRDATAAYSMARYLIRAAHKAHGWPARPKPARGGSRGRMEGKVKR